METQSGLGFAHFISQSDEIAKVVLLVLVLLSVLSWYLIVSKWVGNTLAQRRAEGFIQRFWQMGSISAMVEKMQHEPDDHAFARLARSAIAATRTAQSEQDNLALAGGLTEYLTRVLNNEIDQEAADSEHGLTILASAGSAAPYIGLFGTVWGIYHALVQIGLSGQGTLDKVAGPVGEALIMTAVGLAVAIPAVLAYNAFSRRNRIWLARLESFAHDLYVLLTVKSGNGSGEAAASRSA